MLQQLISCAQFQWRKPDGWRVVVLLVLSPCTALYCRLDQFQVDLQGITPHPHTHTHIHAHMYAQLYAHGTWTSHDHLAQPWFESVPAPCLVLPDSLVNIHLSLIPTATPVNSQAVSWAVSRCEVLDLAPFCFQYTVYTCGELCMLNMCLVCSPAFSTAPLQPYTLLLYLHCNLTGCAPLCCLLRPP